VSAPLSVCFFNRSYAPDAGATGQLLADLAEGLVREHGCRVTVVAGVPLRVAPDEPPPPRPRWLYRRSPRAGVDVLLARGTTLSPGRFAGRAVNYLTYVLSAAAAGLAAPRPDVVVALTDPPVIGLIGYFRARIAGARFVFVCQDLFPEVARLVDDFRSPLVERGLHAVSRFLVGRADRVVAIGETMRACLVASRAADPDKVAVIHNWADCAVIRPGTKDSAFARAHGLADAFVVMHSGNVGLAQDLDTLLAAAARLAGCPGLVVAVVGDGARRSALEEGARALGLAHVRFIPYQPRARLAELFAAADVFVVSLKAGLAGAIVPSKLYGILAAGRPYVAAVDAECEVAAITARHASGLLVRPGDAEGLADGILALYRDPELARRLGANGRRAALEFDRPGQVAAYHALLSDVASRGGRAPVRRLKRAFDAALAGLGLALSSPLWALVALAIKVDDGGPVFFAQERVGRGGRRFRSYKFRSMAPDAEARFGPSQAREGDPRVTRVGAVLRATAADELPQLVNILKGDMSFVGPRPLLPLEIEVTGGGRAVPLETIPGYEERHRVTPGLTGIAQVFAARDLPRRHKFRLDRLYVRRQSFGLDLRLIALSFWISLRGRWERRGRKV
jgi:lipopolysaccharide/colanic/teichoic acid biosynthesis glycosyltransferase/glycosyltransferase involved in cell wall biosynthesis